MIVHNGVTIIGYTDLPSRMATQASQLYGTNLVHLLTDLGGAANFHIDETDEVVRGALVMHEGKITWSPPKPKAVAQPKIEKAVIVPPSATPRPGHKPVKKKGWSTFVNLAVAVIAIFAIGTNAPASFLTHFTVFVLACFVGWQVIWNVTPALHTPLMSVTNAISGIIIIGGMLQLAGTGSTATMVLAGIAVLIASINVAGGFLVTQRMLKMFRR